MRLRMLTASLGMALTLGMAQPAKAQSTCLPSLDFFLQNIVWQNRAPGVALRIEHKGKVMFDKRYGHLARERLVELPNNAIWRIYSMTKPITSVGVMMLVEQGKLSLDDPIARHLPEFSDMKVQTPDGLIDAEGEITVRDLLRHTSGMVYDFFGSGPVRVAYKSAQLRRAGQTNAAMAKQLGALPLEHHPGTHWEYSFSSDMAGYLIEVVSGQRLDAYLKQHIFDPLGMTDTGFSVAHEDAERMAEPFFPPLPSYTGKRTMLSGGGGLASTMDDYMAFLRMLVNGGSLNGHRILKPETVAEMSGDQTISAGIKPGRYYFPGHGHGFGLGFAVKISDDPRGAGGPVGTYFWGGYAGTGFWVDPVNQIAATFMTQTIKDRRLIRAGIRSSFYDDFGLDGQGSGAKGC